MIPQLGTNATGPSSGFLAFCKVSEFPVTQESLYFQHYISVLFCKFLLVFPQVYLNLSLTINS